MQEHNLSEPLPWLCGSLDFIKKKKISYEGVKIKVHPTPKLPQRGQIVPS